MTTRLLVFVLVAAAAIGCKKGGGADDGGGSPTGPTSAPTFNGTYAGSAVGPQNRTSFLLTATVADGVITGTLRDPEGEGQIPLSGTSAGSGEVAMSATDNCGSARYALNGSTAFDSSGRARITGTWSQPAVPGCAGASGAFTMTRDVTGPALNGFPSGTWAGTLSRPEGEPIDATWVATRGPAPNSQSSGSFDGPLTLTYRGATITARMYGFLAGSNTAPTGYRLNFQIEMEPGAVSTLPNCRIFTFSDGGPQNLRDTSTTITFAFDIQYASCQGFISSPSSSSLRESTQIVLNKR